MKLVISKSYNPQALLDGLSSKTETIRLNYIILVMRLLDVKVVPNSPTGMYVTMSAHGVERTFDYGTRWNKSALKDFMNEVIPDEIEYPFDIDSETYCEIPNNFTPNIRRLCMSLESILCELYPELK